MNNEVAAIILFEHLSIKKLSFILSAALSLSLKRHFWFLARLNFFNRIFAALYSLKHFGVSCFLFFTPILHNNPASH